MLISSTAHPYKNSKGECSMYNTDSFTPACFKAHGSMELRGQTVQYDTICEDNLFYNEAGTPVATIFSYSYFRTNGGPSAARPVIFGFNGGPGASSMMVHAGCFGARRVKYPESTTAYPTLPPYEVIDNPDCLLDIADIVMIDPISTGFGLLLDEASAKRFYGIDEDAEALCMFIEHWLTKYGRWNSPRYLAGESYGCTRAATAASIGLSGGQDRSYHIAFDGLIFIGNTVTVTKYFNKRAPVEPAVEAFPSMAAINWYHHPHASQPLESFVMEAADFAAGEYLAALYLGERLAGDAREEMKRKIMYYTGVSSEYLDAHDLCLERQSFCHDVLKREHKVVSIMDGRFARACYGPEWKDGQPGYASDAALERYDPLFRAALGAAIFPSLGLAGFERSFVPSYSLGTELVSGSKWNFETAQLVSGERLSTAMHRNPHMRAFFINGWFDLCTQTGIVWHTMAHTHLPAERTFFKGYPSGHMAYLGEENVKAVSEDIRRFILGQEM